MRALVALLRIEWRSLALAPWRTALLVALVAVPAAVFVAATALQRTALPTTEELRAERFGDAVALVSGGPPEVLAGLAGGAPLGATGALVELEGGEHVLRLSVAHDVELDALAAAARRRGLALERRAALASDTSFETVALQIVGAFGFAVGALVIGAAIAVGLARREQELARVAACGARGRTLALALALATAGIALAGAGLGVGLGAAAAALLLPVVDAWTGRDNGALEFAPSAFALAPALGLVAALAAAAPSIVRVARAAGTVRRPSDAGRQTRASRWRLALALGATLLGSALVLGSRGLTGGEAVVRVAGGSLLGLIGIAGATGATLRWCAGRAARAPLAVRLAARDAARSSGRSSAAALAVLAGLASATLLGSLATAVERIARARGEQPTGIDPLLELALLGAAATGLLVVGAATALNAVEGARDTRLLALHGARPSTLLALHGARAAHLALVGGVLSVPAGLLPALGLVHLADAPLAFAVPWRAIALALLVLPLLSFALGAALGTAIDRRTVAAER